MYVGGKNGPLLTDVSELRCGNFRTFLIQAHDLGLQVVGQVQSLFQCMLKEFAPAQTRFSQSHAVFIEASVRSLQKQLSVGLDHQITGGTVAHWKYTLLSPTLMKAPCFSGPSNNTRVLRL